MLNRCKVMHIHIARTNHDTTRMLACRIFYICKSFCEMLKESTTSLNISKLCIFLYIPKRSLIRDGTNGTGLKYIISAKQFFRVLMSLCLVITREVQINIRNLIAFETKENSKWNIMAICLQWMTAIRTVTTRQIESTGVFTIFIKFRPLTFRANIMWWQWINFCNFRHGCCKGRTYRTTRTYEIAII